MATRADIFYPSTVDQDQTWGTDIRKLLETVPALNSTTICTHANAAGTTQITLDPFTNRSTTGDNRNVFGWAINEAGADGMESTSTRKRRIRSGDWVFTMRLGLPVAGTLTGTLTGSFSARVYRVGPSPTFTLTELFTTALSTTVQSTGLGNATGTCTVTQSSVPEIVLEAGETIHIGYLSNVVQVAGALGATVSGVATWHIGTQGGVDISVNPPAIDTITEMVGTSAGAATVSGVSGKVLPVSGSSSGAATATGTLGAVATTVGSSAGAATVTGTLGSVKGFVGSSAGAATVDGRAATIRGMVGTVEVGAGGETITYIRPIYIFDD